MGMWRKFSEDTRCISLDLRLRVFEKSQGMCVYCGGTAEHIEHVVPWSFCRKSEERNLVASCQLCNLLAHDRMFSSFQAKKLYILMQRAKRGDSVLYPWMSCCTWCHAPFNPGVNGATNLICAWCAATDRQYVERPLAE